MLNDTRIRALAVGGMIERFQDGQIKQVDGKRVISYGLSSFGYDMRIADEFQIFSPATGTLTVIDPKAMDKIGRASCRERVCAQV